AVSWQKNPSTNLNTSIFKLALHPSDVRTMMLQTADAVWMSQDGGATWDALDFGHHTAIYDFVLSPGARNRILAASSRGLLSSRDGGKTWSTMTGGLPEIRFDQVLVVPGLPQELYVLSRDDRQMWRTRNDGSEWSKLDDSGLEGAWLRFIGVGAGQPFVVTENHGVFRLNATEEVAQTFPQAP
ncbi:MAG TPA: hypothetical protein VFR05_02950, partial [Terriglobia bacterium]|nr:hypothetical protein [Terriglobia bacterium]